MGLNQCERDASTKKVMRFKPVNQVELAAFVGAIRPGFQSNLENFLSRRIHTYGIPAMDNLLMMNGATGNTEKSAYVMYDEHVLTLAQAAGIDPGDAVLLIKHIKKKHHDKVLHYKEEFITGFTKHLVNDEKDNESHAKETADAVWKVIEDSASYLFNASHAVAMSYDCLYGAMLKTIAPYEFYKTLLKLYTKKGQTDKISVTVSEMKRYKGIKLTVGKFGQDNRDWFIDKTEHTISQSLASIKGISQQTAEELYKVSIDYTDRSSFVDFLKYILFNTSKINKGHIETLIELGYFSVFGKTEKLLKIFKEFYEGSYKITKTLKSVDQRMVWLREFERKCWNKEVPIAHRLRSELKFTSMCWSTQPECTSGQLFILDVDVKYGVKLSTYNTATGKVTKDIRMKKNVYDKDRITSGDMIKVINWSEKPKTVYRNGMRFQTGEVEYYIDTFKKLSEDEIYG